MGYFHCVNFSWFYQISCLYRSFFIFVFIKIYTFNSVSCICYCRVLNARVPYSLFRSNVHDPIHFLFILTSKMFLVRDHSQTLVRGAWCKKKKRRKISLFGGKNDSPKITKISKKIWFFIFNFFFEKNFGKIFSVIFQIF